MKKGERIKKSPVRQKQDVISGQGMIEIGSEKYPFPTDKNKGIIRK